MGNIQAILDYLTDERITVGRHYAHLDGLIHIEGSTPAGRSVMLKVNTNFLERTPKEIRLYCRNHNIAAQLAGSASGGSIEISGGLR